jgi:hypothetical protein
VKLVEQWRAIENGLPDRWSDARLALTLDDPERAPRALALLAPTIPGRSGRTIRFTAARFGVGAGAESVRRALRRLDAESIAGTLDLVSSGAATPEPALSRPSFAAEWDAALAVLPADWSDLYAELELDSTDNLERAALLLAPVNPSRFGGTPGFRFRAARRFGYGASPGMVRRCFERLDAEHITGEVRVLRALSDTHPVATQGPVWQVGGRTV